MLRKLTVLALSLLTAMATGCGGKAEAEQASAKAEAARLEATRNREIQEPLLEQVKDKMFDAESARLKDVQLSEDELAICGEVNGNNRYGGYVGFKGFIANSNGDVFFDDTGDFLTAEAFAIRALENKCVPAYLKSSGRIESAGSVDHRNTGAKHMRGCLPVESFSGSCIQFSSHGI